MKISQYIKHLQVIQDSHGDLEVESYGPTHDRRTAFAPHVAYRKILSKRESKPDFWSEFMGSDTQGDKVVQV